MLVIEHARKLYIHTYNHTVQDEHSKAKRKGRDRERDETGITRKAHDLDGDTRGIRANL